ASPPLTVDVHIGPGDRRRALEHDVLTGLTGPAKRLPPVWFYDERGSILFDAITRLPEYYPTRAEREILRRHAGDIVERAGAGTLVELGSGTSEKTRLLLDAMSEAELLQRFVPFDVSEEVLTAAAAEIGTTYDCAVHAVVGDFHRHLGAVPDAADGRLVVFLGSTIGNLDPAERRRFLFDLDAVMTIDDHLLLGTDLVKDTERLVAAYDDAAGVTAEFNRNVLSVLNAEFDGDLEPARFDHVARWNEQESWIEMHLRATEAHDAHLAGLGLDLHFDDGEELHTEISSKFRPEQVADELHAAGFVVEEAWTDPDGDFLLTLARPYC
ncbi:MAG TPA: L-histidine N(alpha)-methyltransferase, partial [Acidimicrobiales bacterium]